MVVKKGTNVTLRMTWLQEQFKMTQHMFRIMTIEQVKIHKANNVVSSIEDEVVRKTIANLNIKICHHARTVLVAHGKDANLTIRKLVTSQELDLHQTAVKHAGSTTEEVGAILRKEDNVDSDILNFLLVGMALIVGQKRASFLTEPRTIFPGALQRTDPQIYHRTTTQSKQPINKPQNNKSTQICSNR